MRVSQTAEQLERKLDAFIDAAFGRVSPEERERIKLALMIYTDAVLRHHNAVELAKKGHDG